MTPERRQRAIEGGLSRWTEPGCSAASLEINGSKSQTIVDATIRANQSEDARRVFPSRVTANERLWREPVTPEFYVDFETVSDLDDDFAEFPEAGGQPLIFMIGCGHFSGTNRDEPNWSQRVFTAHSLTLAEERRVVEDWLAHMRQVCTDHDVSLEQSRVFHWSPAETSALTEAYNAAAVRQRADDWPDLPWVDLLNRLVREQPVTVNGAFGFGLKAVAKALHRHGLIETLWQDGPTDGLGAMVGAWCCDHESRRTGTAMSQLDLMKEIESYNAVDCRVMAEALTFLRQRR